MGANLSAAAVESLNHQGLQDKQRLSSAEVRSLCQELFGGLIPVKFESAFAEVAGGFADIELFYIFKILYRFTWRKMLFKKLVFI